MKFALLIGACSVIVHLLTMLPCGQSAAGELMDLDIYDQKTIYLYHSFLGNGFVRDGQVISMGTLGSNLAEEMSGSPYALEEMRRYRKYRIAGTATNLVAMGFSITGIVLAFRDHDDNTAFEISSIVVGAVCGVFAEAFNRSAMAAMNRAVWLYNRDVVSGRFWREEGTR